MFVRFRGTYCGATNRDERPAGVDKILNAGREFVTTTSPGGDDHGFAYPAFPNRAYLKLDRIATTGADWRIHLEVGAITAEKLLSAALFDHDAHKNGARFFKRLGWRRRIAHAFRTDLLAPSKERHGKDRNGESDADDICRFEKHGCSLILLLTINDRGNSSLKTTHTTVLFPLIPRIRPKIRPITVHPHPNRTSYNGSYRVGRL